MKNKNINKEFLNLLTYDDKETVSKLGKAIADRNGIQGKKVDNEIIDLVSKLNNKADGKLITGNPVQAGHEIVQEVLKWGDK